MRIHIIQHESFEDLGAIAAWIDQNQYATSITQLDAGDRLPESVTGFDFLIIMGGPQSTTTTLAECPYFDAKKEIALIKKAIDNNKLVLGICLGAQMIGEAYDARCEHSPHPEIGVFPLTLTAAAKSDPFFSTLPQQIDAAHWHGDMPGLSRNAVVLAESKGCPRQVIRYSDRVYGFQSHFEFDQPSVIGMLVHCAHELKDAGRLPYIQDAETLRNSNYGPMNKMLFKFLDFMVAKDKG